MTINYRFVRSNWGSVTQERKNLGVKTRSYYLTTLVYFLWGYVKAHSNTDNPASTDAEDNIEIPAEMLERVCPNWTKRMDL